MRTVVLAVVLAMVLVTSSNAGPDVITYQGSLVNSGGRPIPDGRYRMQFKLYDHAVAGSNQWEETHSVEVIRGLFSVALGRTTPLHRVFMKYPDLWMEVTVDADRSNTFEPSEVYSPRRSLSGVPWACPRVEPREESPNLIGGIESNSAGDGVVGATIGGGGGYVESGPLTRIITNRVTDNYGTVGGGRNNRAGDSDAAVDDAVFATVGGGRDNVSSASFATVSGGRNNRADGSGATIGGGFNNTAEALRATIGGGFNNIAEASYATIGGGEGNDAAGGYATVAGGYGNLATGLTSTVGGGIDNTADSISCVVAGGEQNVASGSWSAIGGGLGNVCGDLSAVGGGLGNEATGWGSAVCGGTSNTATRTWATVAGGRLGEASAPYSFVAGGLWNTASGDCSFAAGCRAKALGKGCFVWADSETEDFEVNTADRFAARAQGGVYFYTNDTLTAGSYLAAGSGSWASVSDRNQKENLAPVDPKEVLDKVAELPVSTWNYNSEDASIRHMGPMAQDLHDAFGLGDNERSIATIDADGIALAAIQGLHQRLREKDAEIIELRARLEAQQREEAATKKRLEALEAAVAQFAAGAIE